MARLFHLLRSLGMSGAGASYRIGYIMEDPVTQTTLWRYYYWVEAKAKEELKKLIGTDFN